MYEFITRRFLACCSKDALGWETTVEVDYGGEEFSATGKPNFLHYSLIATLPDMLDRTEDSRAKLS